MNQFVAAIVAVVVVLSLIQSVIAAQGDTPVTATTNSIICHEHAYDETCLTQSWSPWTQSWTEVYRQQQCCLTFWLKRLSPELQTDSTPPPSPLYTKDIWGNVFNSVPNTTEKKELKQKHKADQNAFQKRYEHVAEPTIRFVTSKTQIISIVANSPRAYVFILPRFIPPQHEEETEVEVEMWRSGKLLKVISTVGQLHQSLSTHPARKQLESEEHHRNDNKRFGVIPFGMNPTIVDLL